jgi:hypothetical protein
METKIKWNEGEGYITATYEGSGNGSASISSDINEGIDREQSIKVETTDKSVSATLVVLQEGLREVFEPSDGLFVLANGGTFNVLKVGGDTPDVPVETYTRLTYIECNGQQYINTGYVVQEDDIIEMDFVKTSSTNVDKAIFGASDGVNGLWFSLYGANAYYRFGNGSSDNASGAGNKYRVTLKKGYIDVDGLTESIGFNAMPNLPLYLFARNSSNTSVTMWGYCKTRGFKITKQTGEVVMELNACKRDSDGKIGMLDVVSGTFYVNEGTGADFSFGEEIRITSDYELLDYVTFAKNNLYDLGIVKSTYKLEVMFARSEKTTTPYLYGCVTSPHTASVTAYLSQGGAWRFGAYYKGLTMNNTDTHLVQMENGKYSADFIKGTFSKSTFTTPDTVVLGGYRAASGSLVRNYQGNVFYFRISEGSTMVLDWYPCKRLSDGVEGFWDCVTQSFIEPF